VTPRGWPHIAGTYDVVASDYADRFSDELDGKPFDLGLLDRLASEVAGHGLVCDLGCGPGQIGAYLAGRGCQVLGVDLSPGMLRCARERHRDLAFGVGDMRALPLADASCAAVACFYSLIHIPRPQVPAVLAEMTRVLRGNGSLVLAVHEGAGEAHVDDWFGHAVAVDATLFHSDELAGLVEEAGFTECRASVREPYPTEPQRRRLYIQATRS
jgi:ubiquinone/menaquinone biosynthesis C-methylase UbiE